MRLLVLGGTAFLSRAVASSAITSGDDVVCAARGESGAPPTGARFVTLDRNDPAGLAAVVDSGPYDVVLDVSSKPSFVRAALAALAGHTEHWIYVSSASAYADNATPGQRASDAPTLPPAGPDVDDPTDFDNYGPCKVACEQAVIEAMGAAHAFICRAGLIVGPEDASGRFTYWPTRLDRARRAGAGLDPQGEVLAPGNPDDLVQWVDVRDLAEWLVRAARTRMSGIFDGIGSPVSRAEFLTGVAAGAGVSEPALTWVDQEFLLEHDVNPWAGPRSLPLWLPLPEYAGFLSRDVSASIAAGLTLRDIEDTTRSTLLWWREAQDHDHGKAGLTVDEERVLLAAWHGAHA
jgi:nucleoside-diphosphate-sugar epimerase